MHDIAFKSLNYKLLEGITFSPLLEYFKIRSRDNEVPYKGTPFKLIFQTETSASIISQIKFSLQKVLYKS